MNGSDFRYNKFIQREFSITGKGRLGVLAASNSSSRLWASGKRKTELNCNGIMEFNSIGNNLRNVWMDRLLFMVYQFLSSSNLEFPTQKVIHSSFYFTFLVIHSNNTNTIYFYPLNSVAGLNFDFVVLNLTKQSSYLIYNASLYFSSDIQHQYIEKIWLWRGILFIFSSPINFICSFILAFPCSVLG